MAAAPTKPKSIHRIGPALPNVTSISKTITAIKARTNPP